MAFVKILELNSGAKKRICKCEECGGLYDVEKDYRGLGYSFEDECLKCTYTCQERRFRQEGGTGPMS